MDVGHFHLADYIIFASTLFISVGIGLYYACKGGKQRTTSEYLLGNRKMGIFPIAMSLLASLTSPLAILGMPSEIYTYGIEYYYKCLGILLALPVVVYNFIPVFFNLRLTSVHEYVELRFNRTLRQVASVLYVIAMTIYCSFVIYGPAISLRQVTGLNILWSVATIGLVGTFYTSIVNYAIPGVLLAIPNGGIKAVMWTDVVQCILMFLALSATCIKGTIDVGGISSLISRNTDGNRLNQFSFSFIPRVRYTFWGCSLAEFIRWSVEFGVFQTQVQRYLSAPLLKNARVSLLCNGLIIMYSLCCFIGFILYSKYWQCDPLISHKLDAPDQIVPFFVMETTSDYPGLAGLFVAGIYSGSLSTISSVFNALSAVILEDFVRKINRWESIDDKKATKISKIITLIFGIFCLTLASLGDYFGSIISASSYNINVFTGALSGIFIAGLFFPWTTSLGTLIGVVVGMIFGFWITIGSQLSRYVHPRLPISIEGCTNASTTNYTFPITDDNVFDLYKISYMWVLPLVIMCVVTVSLIASFVTGANNSRTVNPQLLAPITKALLRTFSRKKFNDYAEYERNSSARREKNQDLADASPITVAFTQI